MMLRNARRLDCDGRWVLSDAWFGAGRRSGREPARSAPGGGEHVGRCRVIVQPEGISQMRMAYWRTEPAYADAGHAAQRSASWRYEVGNIDIWYNGGGRHRRDSPISWCVLTPHANAAARHSGTPLHLFAPAPGQCRDWCGRDGSVICTVRRRWTRREMSRLSGPSVAFDHLGDGILQRLARPR